MLRARLIRASNASQPHRRREVLGVPEPSRYVLATCLKMHSARRTEASVGREPQRALPDLKTSLFPEVDVGVAAKLEALRNFGALIGAETLLTARIRQEYSLRYECTYGPPRAPRS